MLTKGLLILFIVLVSLTNYKLAKLAQEFILNSGISNSYLLSLSVPWLLVGILPSIVFWSESGLRFTKKLISKNLKKIILLAGFVLAGLFVFVLLGITKYFHDVKFPIIFFLVTPIVEELIFRGWVFGKIEKMNIGSPILLSSLLFGLHHSQYFNYQISLFLVFQVVYTFFLGLLLAKTRKLSGSLYIGIIIHVLINYLTLKF